MLPGIIVYVLIRSGIRAGIGVSQEQASSIFLVTATGIVAGLYTREIYDKFHEVFNILFKTQQQRTDQLEPAKKFPPTVADIVKNAIMPDEVEVSFYAKNHFSSADIDAPCKHAISLDKDHWRTALRDGKDGVFWVRDEDQKIVCQYYKRQD